jgi:hypothetical protein
MSYVRALWLCARMPRGKSSWKTFNHVCGLRGVKRSSVRGSNLIMQDNHVVEVDTRP